MQYQNDRKWCVFSNGLYQATSCVNARTGQQHVGSSYVRHFHGTTLWQAIRILTEGFKASLYHKGSKSSPCGIWGCTRRGDCLERAHLVRGWSRHAAEPTVSGCDCPVVLCILVPDGSLHKHESLKNGTVVRCWKKEPDTVVDIAGQYCEVHFFVDLYDRFRTLFLHWQHLKQGDRVLCRSVLFKPETIFNDNPGAMTCGRSVFLKDTVKFSAWTCAQKSCQYRCPECDILCTNNWPLSGQDQED